MVVHTVDKLVPPSIFENSMFSIQALVHEAATSYSNAALYPQSHKGSVLKGREYCYIPWTLSMSSAFQGFNTPTNSFRHES